MESHSQAPAVELPASTAWPMVLALGLSLVIAGMVTNAAISVLGLLLTVRASVGWFRQVLPIEHHESVVVDAQSAPVIGSPIPVARISISPMHRKMLPVETYKITAGIKGGIAGGVAMSIPAMLYGWVKYHSIWYAINLLAAGGFISWAGRSDQFLGEFHLRGFPSRRRRLKKPDSRQAALRARANARCDGISIRRVVDPAAAHDCNRPHRMHLSARLARHP
jgi:hypothetical protein